MTQDAGARGLTRLRQIAKEEAAAIQVNDTETLCRLTALLPHAISDCELAIANTNTQCEIDNSQLFDEIRQAHEQAERYLQEQMRSVRLLLQQCAMARRTLKAYGKRGPLAQVDNRG